MYFMGTFLFMFFLICPPQPDPIPLKCKNTASNLFYPAKGRFMCLLLQGLPRDNGIHVLVCASEQDRNTDTLKCVCQLMDANNDKSRRFYEERNSHDDEDPSWMNYLPELLKLVLPGASLYNLCIGKTLQK